MQGKVQHEARSAHTVYIGIDVGKELLDVHVHPADEHQRLGNDRAGVGRLVRLLAGRPVGAVVIEATGKYHRRACRALAQAGFAVTVVNPVRARRFAEAAGLLAKTDRVDARMLAWMGAALELPPTPPQPEAIEALAELVRARKAAVAERTALSNRLAESQVAFLRRELQHRIKSLEGHIERLEVEIARRIAAEPAFARREQILRSICGFGPATAAGLIAELPELGSLDRRTSASLAGLAPFADDSASRSGQRRIRGGRSHARYHLYWAARAAARHNPSLSAFYNRLLANGKERKIALTAVMRKLVILANTLIAENRKWLPDPP